MVNPSITANVSEWAKILWWFQLLSFAFAFLQSKILMFSCWVSLSSVMSRECTNIVPNALDCRKIRIIMSNYHGKARTFSYKSDINPFIIYSVITLLVPLAANFSWTRLTLLCFPRSKSVETTYSSNTL